VGGKGQFSEVLKKVAGRHGSKAGRENSVVVQKSRGKPGMTRWGNLVTYDQE